MNMGMKIARMLLLAAVAFGQTPEHSEDPQGWTLAKWGMSQEEIKAAFPEAQRGASPDMLHLQKYIISGKKYAVSFSFDPHGQLSGVRLSYQKVLVRPDGSEVGLLRCDGCDPSSDKNASASRSAQKQSSKSANFAAEKKAVVLAAVNGMIIGDEKDSLLSMLTEKYGNPTAVHSQDDGTQTFFEWLFTSTKITLLWFHGQFKDLDSVGVFYAPRNKSSNL